MVGGRRNATPVTVVEPAHELTEMLASGSCAGSVTVTEAGLPGRPTHRPIPAPLWLCDSVANYL